MKVVVDNNAGRKLFNDLQKMGIESEYLDEMERDEFAEFLATLKGSILVTETKELIRMCKKRGIKAIRMNPVATFVGAEECRPRTLRVLNKLENELFRLYSIAKIDLNYVINWTESMQNLKGHCERMRWRIFPSS